MQANWYGRLGCEGLDPLFVKSQYREMLGELAFDELHMRAAVTKCWIFFEQPGWMLR